MLSLYGDCVSVVVLGVDISLLVVIYCLNNWYLACVISFCYHCYMSLCIAASVVVGSIVAYVNRVLSRTFTTWVCDVVGLILTLGIDNKLPDRRYELICGWWNLCISVWLNKRVVCCLIMLYICCDRFAYIFVNKWLNMCIWLPCIELCLSLFGFGTEKSLLGVFLKVLECRRVLCLFFLLFCLGI